MHRSLVRAFDVSDPFDILDHMFDTVVRCGDQLAGAVARLDPDVLSGETAQSWWYALDRVERLAAGGKTLLARRLAAKHSPPRSGQRSAAEAMARDAGTSVGAAKDALDTSERLPELDKVEAAVRRGELSPAQAAVISDAAAADRSAQDRLLGLASKGSMSQLTKECARVRAAADPDPDATHRRIHAARRLRHYTDPEGGWNLTARGTAQAGAAFLTVLTAVTDAIFRQARRQGRCEPVEAYAFDALMHLAEHAAGRCDSEPQPDTATVADTDSARADDTAGTDNAGDVLPGGESSDHTWEATDLTGEGDAEPTTDDDHGSGTAGHPALSIAATGERSAAAGTAGEMPEPTQPAGAAGIFAASAQRNPVCPARPVSRQSVNPRYLALLRVDVAALRRGRVAGGELCEIAGVGPVPVSVARDLLGDAVLKLVITRGVDVVNVTHLGRGPTAAQRAALLWTNLTCAVEGCDRRRVEWDHQIPWAETRHTRLDELDPLCGFHHDLKTRLGYALVPGTGKRAFVAPDDPRHPRHQPDSRDRPTGTGGPGDGGPSDGRDRPTRRDGPSAPERPTGRPAQRRAAGAANDAGSGRPPGQRRRTAATGRQPDLFAEPQPP